MDVCCPFWAIKYNPCYRCLVAYFGSVFFFYFNKNSTSRRLLSAGTKIAVRLNHSSISFLLLGSVVFMQLPQFIQLSPLETKCFISF